MSKEAMKQALEALYLAVRIEPSDSIHECPEMFQGAITALRNELAKQEQGEPVAWMFQHEDTGLTDCVDAQQVEWGFEKNNPRWQKIGPLYTKPQPSQKPLTHEQRFDLLTAFEPHKNKWEAPAILIDMVEAAHGIKE